MNKFVDRLVNARGLKGFFDRPLEQQVQLVIKGAIVIAILTGLAFLVLSVGVQRAGGFVLLLVICAPFSLLLGSIKSRARARSSKTKGGMTPDDDTI